MARKKESALRLLKILVLHGPNLNLLGTREPEKYGSITLKEINQALRHNGKELGATVEPFQSNHEGRLITMIQKSPKKYQGILINPAGYTHTSVALRDALAAIDIPTVEIHLTNIYERETFRQASLTAPVCIGQVTGFGAVSYLLGLNALIHILRES